MFSTLLVQRLRRGFFEKKEFEDKALRVGEESKSAGGSVEVVYGKWRG